MCIIISYYSLYAYILFSNLSSIIRTYILPRSVLSLHFYFVPYSNGSISESAAYRYSLSSL